MKEAIIADLNGKYQEPTIVPDEQTGVTPIYAAPEPPEEGEEPEEKEPEVIGYIVAEKVPDGLYLPRWDFINSEWIEGLTQEEIDAIRNAPQPVTSEQRIAELETANGNLRSDNLTLMEAVAELYEMILAGGAA
ncbi:hypothetical protein [Cohnella nanjingensis]|uniref:Bacteriophage SP-beta YorD domain-containing protein n=1 Tax=Cohnella nanjingensis TaxID=1387779 RepID=A0A7X0RMN7_9BACL|nr:hypothetical protein [Cohnella nanjingensis]MBB6670292.1 hypothetical protein [Cohnella nanjingensis]